MPDDLTLGEAVRRFEVAITSLQNQLASLTEELREERRSNERIYVRKDVYASDQKLNKSRMEDIEEDIDQINKRHDEELGFRRQVLLAGALLAITTLVSIAIAISNLLAR